jgi:hypothetical protein
MIYDIVCAFEVFEHLSNPAGDLACVFNRAHQLVLIGTQLYEKQGPDWWYINSPSGQHVFFYSRGAMAHIATRFGFHYYSPGALHLFSKLALTKTQQRLLTRVMSEPAQKWVRAYLGYRLSFDAAARDSGLFVSKT